MDQGLVFRVRVVEARMRAHSLDASFPGFLWQVEAVGLDTATRPTHSQSQAASGRGGHPPEVGEAREELHHRPRERGKFVVIHIQAALG